MAKSATRPHAAGFSLLELLLTLVIVGLIVSLAGLGVSSGSRPYQIDGAIREFADIAEYALDEAQLSGIDMGLFVDERSALQGRTFSYQWLQRTAVGWELARVDVDIYGKRNMPPALDVLLEVEQGNALRRERSDLDEEEQRQPEVVFFSSGETTPGIMSWVDEESGELLWELEWDLLGRIEMRRHGEVNDDEED